MITIFLIHQSAHFGGASTAQPGAKKPEDLQNSNPEEVFVENEKENLNNISNCKEKVFQGPENASGVLPVECLLNNVVPLKLPTAGFDFTVTVETANHTSGGDGTDPNGGIKTVVKRASGHGPNGTVSKGPPRTVFGVAGVDAKNKTYFINPFSGLVRDTGN
jgi:hypothetical protein